MASLLEMDKQIINTFTEDCRSILKICESLTDKMAALRCKKSCCTGQTPKMPNYMQVCFVCEFAILGSLYVNRRNR